VNASDYFQAGQLDAATSGALAEVKANPADVPRRCFLSDLLCFAGDLDRADKQLEAAAQFGSPHGKDIVLRRQLVRAEKARRQVFVERRVPELLEQPSEDLRLRMQAIIATREGKHDQSRGLLAQAESQRTPLQGQCNQQPFEGFSDLDELTSSFFEVFTANGKYYWISFGEVQRLEFQAPAEPRDLLWRCARILLQGGSAPALEGVVYFPALYYGSAGSADSRVKLGRMTDWTGGGEEPYRGLGQRLFQVGTLEIPMLELNLMEFQQGDHKEV
jgi:type VI secretion system protein ImpE